MNKNGVSLCIILIFLLGILATCTYDPEVISKEGSILVYAGLLISAKDYPTVAGGFSNSHDWFLTLEGKAKIVIRKSRFWFAPIGKEVFIYKRKDKHASPHEYYIELEERK